MSFRRRLERQRAQQIESHLLRAEAIAAGEPMTLGGLKVAVDVQHLYRPHHPTDQGAVFRREDIGTTITESQAATLYAIGLCQYLRQRGAAVLTNDPVARRLVGHYSDRKREAAGWGAQCYLACHVNAGRGSYGAAVFVKGTEVERDSSSLAVRIAREVRSHNPELGGRVEVRAILARERGGVCIRNFPRAALILEPFFGDQPDHQPLLDAQRLYALGVAIGLGVERWWRAS